jgi:Zn-dependent protease with chaperone function
MNDDRFTSLVRKLEILARDRPDRYKTRVAILAAIGYAYIVLVLVVLAIPIALLLVFLLYTRRPSPAIVQFIFILSIPVFLIARSLWDAITMKFPSPEGMELSREKTPRLFDLLDRLQTSLSCPPPRRVLLTGDTNAAIVRVPRFGFLGWGEDSLLIGLPLLQALSVEEFTAVLAHEFGHLSGDHGTFQGRIYHLRQTWSLLLDRMSGGRRGESSVLFDAFFRWYIPFFNAYTFVLARADEYEADRHAVALVGRDTTASALIGTAVRGERIENDFWNPLYQRAIDAPDPPEKPFTELAALLRTPIDENEAKRSLERALARSTDRNDTHPCLLDRLEAIGYSPKQAFTLLGPAAANTAESLLEPSLAALTEELNERWRASIAFRWREEHTGALQTRERLETLDRQALYRELLIDEAWERANLTARVKGDEAAIPLLRSLLQRAPSHPTANFLLGRILLSREEEKGIEYLQKAMGKEPALAIEGCQWLADYYLDRGRVADAESYRRKAIEHYQDIQRADAERATLTAGDRFLPHGLARETVMSLRRQIGEYPEIHSAYLVRKAVNTFPEIPLYILGILRRRIPFESARFDRERNLVDRLATTLLCPGQTRIVILNASNRRLGRALQNVDNSRIYS